MKNIVLIGMPGCGKTTFGRYLAELLQMDFIDADPEIEKDTGKTIPELFAVSEDWFRQCETATVRRLARLEGKVLAMGGGVILRPENIRALKENGVVIYLDRHPDDIVSDVDMAYRPLLKGGTGRVYELYDQRHRLYEEAADITVPNKGTRKDVLKALLEAGRKIREESK
ncbi:MAG: shikimate kinase [Succiniclasticum sp.]|jgi:shikimate kinase|nr:shikimate kinase [Succiniclasticum sp.]MEE3479188.1 shikimate kinase [Succiniclasticum sp.]